MSPKAFVCARFRDGKRKKRENLAGFFATEECKKVNFSTSARFLSRNATFFALKRHITFNPAGKCKMAEFYIPQSQKPCETFPSPK